MVNYLILEQCDITSSSGFGIKYIFLKVEVKNKYTLNNPNTLVFRMLWAQAGGMMGQWLRVLVAHAEELGLEYSVTAIPGDLLPTSGLQV